MHCLGTWNEPQPDDSALKTNDLSSFHLNHLHIILSSPQDKHDFPSDGAILRSIASVLATRCSFILEIAWITFV